MAGNSHGDPITTANPAALRDRERISRLDAGALYLFNHLKPGHGQQAGEVAGPGPRTFEGVDRTVASVAWLDNGEALEFEQKAGALTVTATGFPYGTNTVVRVARAS